MSTAQSLPNGYAAKRDGVEQYFDRTAAKTWEQLTSDAPVSRIRATVRKGRDAMREQILSWLPNAYQSKGDQSNSCKGLRILDAGCGPGAMTIELVKRGANVVAVDLSPALIEVAKKRYSSEIESLGCSTFNSVQESLDAPADKAGVCWLAGDLLEPNLGQFDVIITMDCLIHYNLAHSVEVLDRLSKNCNSQIIFTYAPSNPFLEVMHSVGKLFPSKDRSPRIEPIEQRKIESALSNINGWSLGRTGRISSGFYTSQALELKKQ
jgi:magnesium-protoporphyrin O-methyltransferase